MFSLAKQILTKMNLAIKNPEEVQMYLSLKFPSSAQKDFQQAFSTCSPLSWEDRLAYPRSQTFLQNHLSQALSLVLILALLSLDLLAVPQSTLVESFHPSQLDHLAAFLPPFQMDSPSYHSIHQPHLLFTVSFQCL